MKSYILFGQTVTFDDAAEHAYSLQVELTQVKADAEDRLRSWYMKQESIEKVIDGFNGFVNALYREQFVDRLYPRIQTCGIYDITTDMYQRRCLSKEGAKRALAEVRAQYDAIEEQKNAEEQYRADRKASRERWEGGGFGLGGALKGAATAGALNTVTGLGHDIVNTAGNLSSAAAASSAKSALYRDKATLSTLKKGLDEDIQSFFNSHVQLIQEYHSDYFNFCFDAERGKALFDNAQQFPDKRIELLVQSFKACPWNEVLQRYIFRNYPDERREIFRASHDWWKGIDDCVDELLSVEYTEEAQRDESAAQQAKVRILAMMREYGMLNSNTLNRLETDCLNRLCPNIEQADEETCKSYRIAVEEYAAQQQIKDEFIKRIDERVNSIWSTEDTADCKKIYLAADLSSEASVKQATQKIKANARTSSHEPYIKALETCSAQNIHEARMYYCGILPQVYSALGWVGMAVCIINLLIWQFGGALSVLALVAAIVFAILRVRTKNMYNTLTLDGTVLHRAITQNNRQTSVHIPGIVWAIPIVVVIVAAVAFVLDSTDTPSSAQGMPDAEQYEYDQHEAASEHEDDIPEEETADTPTEQTDSVPTVGGYMMPSFEYDDDGSPLVMTVNGSEVHASEYAAYFYYDMQLLKEQYAQEGLEFSWSDDGLEEIGATIPDSAKSSVILEHVLCQKIYELGLSVSEDELQALNDTRQQAIDNDGGEEAYLNQIAQSGFDDRTYCNLLYTNQCYQVLKNFWDEQDRTLGVESTIDDRVQEWTDNAEVLTSELFDEINYQNVTDYLPEGVSSRLN